MKPAFVMNTHLRTQYLEATLKLFEHQGARIVVSDSGAPSDEMYRVLRDVVRPNSAITLIEPPDGEVRDSVHKTWNRAIEMLLPEGYDPIFVGDEGLVPSWNFVERIVSLMEDEPEIGMVGPIHQAGVNEQYPLKEDSHVLQGLDFDPLNLEKLSRDLQVRADSASIRFRTTPFIESHIRAVRARVFKDVGLFDEGYWVGWLGDAEFCCDIRQKGWEIAVCHKALIWHYRDLFFPLATKNEWIKRDTKHALKRWGTGEKISEALRRGFVERRG